MIKEGNLPAEENALFQGPADLVEKSYKSRVGHMLPCMCF